MQKLEELIKKETEDGTKSITIYLDKDGNEVTDPNKAVQIIYAIYDKDGNRFFENYGTINRESNRER